MLHAVPFRFCDFLKKKGLVMESRGVGGGRRVYKGAAGGVGGWNRSASWLCYLHTCQNSGAGHKNKPDSV